MCSLPECSAMYECVCCIVSYTALNKYSPNASRIARPAPTIGWIPVREKRRMRLGLVLGVAVRVAEPCSSWLLLRGYCQRLSLLPSFRLLRGVVERDPVGLNSTLDPLDWLVGLECGWGLAGFDLVGAVSSIPTSTSTQDRTSIWYDVTFAVTLFQMGLLACRKDVLFYNVRQFLLFVPIH